MAWRLAKGLETLRSQVNEKWPNRRKDSDGSVGDTSHAARPSDHNPDSRGIVHAIDITHDPRGGFDSYAFADMLLKNQDRRLSYVISNRRIGSGPAGPSPGKWRPYNGSNAHDHHCHVSITKAGEDDASPWGIDGMSILPSPDVAKDYVPPKPTVRRGSHGEYVKLLQSKLGFEGDEIDGDFGPKTEMKLKVFQAAANLVVDGICGPQTWAALDK